MNETSNIKGPSDMEEHGYEALLRGLDSTFDFATRQALFDERAPLFRTSVRGLYNLFLAHIPPADRKGYDCRACRHFVDTYGPLVTVSDIYKKNSVFWNELRVPPYFEDAVRELRQTVCRADIEDVYLNEKNIWGTTKNHDHARGCEWHHMHLVVPSRYIYLPSKLQTTEQRMAELREDYKLLAASIVAVDSLTLDKAIAMLQNGMLPRPEKVLPVAEWVRATLSAYRHNRNYPVLWRETALAPKGFAHFKNGVLGKLLEDLAQGLPLDEVKRRYSEMLDPLAYQRPQAPPKAGTIDRAEKIVAELESAGALRRRFARLADVQEWVWQPKPAEENKGGVFGHLRNEKKVEAQGISKLQPITWVKFLRDVLPSAQTIETNPDDSERLASLLTAVSPEAPPILQWDSEERRNPVSWFFYSIRHPISRWGLRPDRFYPLSGITYYPHMWGNPEGHKNQGKGVFFIIEGAKDSGAPGLCLFPEILRSEYREIRSVIEAHSNKGQAEQHQLGECTGIALKEGDLAARRIHLRVTTKNIISNYSIDRWE